MPKMLSYNFNDETKLVLTEPVDMFCVGMLRKKMFKITNGIVDTISTSTI